MLAPLDRRIPESGSPTMFGEGVSPPQDVNNYGGTAPVSFDIWQRQLAFDRGDGSPRETIARTRDAQAAYENYVNTWNGSDEATRNAIDVQHGFATAPEVPPISSGGGGSGGDDGGSVTEPFVDRIEEAADAPRDEITPPATGLEATVNTQETTADEVSDVTPGTVFEQGTNGDITSANPNNVVDRSSTDEELEEARVVNNFAPATPSDIVVDPQTGQRFSSPAEARRAGVVNWVYADEEDGKG